MILITGATGFVGKHLLYKLDKYKEFDIITLGRNRKNDIVADLTDIDSLKILKNYDIDILIHLASAIPGKKSEKENKNDYFNTNVIGTYNLLDSLNRKHLKKIILLSSVSIYECSDYGKSKYIQELLTRTFCNCNHDYNNADSTRYLIFRPSSIYGKGMHNTVLKIFYDKSKRDEDIEITVEGYRQNFVYVKDVAKIIKMGLEIGNSGIYDLFSNDTVDLIRLAEIIIEINNSRSKIVENYAKVHEKVYDNTIYDRINNDKFVFKFASLYEGLKNL